MCGFLSLTGTLYAKSVAERFEITKAGVVPAVAGSVPPSKASGSQKEAEIEEMQGIPYGQAERGPHVGANYYAPRHRQCRSHGGNVFRQTGIDPREGGIDSKVASVSFFGRRARASGGNEYK